MRILLLDNYDSFTRNLEHLLTSALPTALIDICPYDAMPMDFSHWQVVVISPGPGAPSDYDYNRLFSSPVAVLGICLGMQIINSYFGGKIAMLDQCVHGKTDSFTYKGARREVARYHSLYCQTIGSGLQVLARNNQEIPMILLHESRNIMGLQFHPESFMTKDGVFFIHDALQQIHSA